jgi:hypothetical protein
MQKLSSQGISNHIEGMVHENEIDINEIIFENLKERQGVIVYS